MALFDNRETTGLFASVQHHSHLVKSGARGKVSRVRLRHGLLWVLGKHARWVEVYDVTDPSTPILLGSMGSEGAAFFSLESWDSLAFAIESAMLVSYRYEQVTP